MELTGKCKTDFEKWYFEVYCVEHRYGLMRFFALTSFYKDTTPEQYGVYVDFFDSHTLNCTIDMYIDAEMNYDGWFTWSVIERLDKTHHGYTEFRRESRERAIETANNLYNENNY